MSDPHPSTAVARPAETPAPKTSSSTTWIALAAAALLSGGVIALAFSGNEERSQPTLADEVDFAEAPAAAVAPAVAEPALPAAPMTLATASQSISIEMYSATWCQACQAAHRWMDQEGIAYHTIDVDRQASAQAQLSMLNPHRTLPTFDIDGQVLVGFDQVALTSAIDGAARRHPR